MKKYFKVVGQYGYTEKEIEYNKSQAKWLLFHKVDSGCAFTHFIKSDLTNYTLYLCNATAGSLRDVLVSEFRNKPLEDKYDIPINEERTCDGQGYLLRVMYLEHVAKHGTIPTRRTVKTWALKNTLLIIKGYEDATTKHYYKPIQR